MYCKSITDEAVYIMQEAIEMANLVMEPVCIIDIGGELDVMLASSVTSGTNILEIVQPAFSNMTK